MVMENKMEKFGLKISTMNLDGLVAKVSAMTSYIANAQDDDPFAALASEIGELDANDCISASVECENGVLLAEVYPVGKLKRLLDAFEANGGSVG